MIDPKDGETILSQMLRIRKMEEACAEQYAAGHIRGFLHLYIGEEAVAVGVMENLRAEDAVFATYREHSHALLRGTPARTIMAEMFGKLEGCCRGRGGSMHLFDRDRRFYGGNAIVGGALPLAVGMALAAQMSHRKEISVCFFGEGAMAEGIFHESMNLASLWKLPVLFVCENNLYAMGTALERSQAETDLVKKAIVYRVPSARVDGMDVIAVKDATQKARALMEEEGGPYFLECQTYRFRAHSMFDPELYRDKTEVERWKKRDPIDLFARVLLEQGSLDETRFRSLAAEAEQEMQDAVRYAASGTEEAREDLERFVYADNPS
jgi:pyruvate dehydrogenase E1 component alpha subunit